MPFKTLNTTNNNETRTLRLLTVGYAPDPVIEASYTGVVLIPSCTLESPGSFYKMPMSTPHWPEILMKPAQMGLGWTQALALVLVVLAILNVQPGLRPLDLVLARAH